MRTGDAWFAGTSEADGGYEALTALAAQAPPGSGGVLFCPWLNGERTPVDDALTRGGWLNLSLDTTRAQLVRSLEPALLLLSLVDARLFARIRRMQSRFDALSQRLAQGFAGLPEDDGLAEIDAAIGASPHSNPV